MDRPEQFEQANDHACYSPEGVVSLHQAVCLVSLAIAYAREQQIPRLMVDATRLTGFDPPTVAERFSIGAQLARSGQGAVKVALVTQPEMIDPERFGIVVANKRGLVSEIFTTRAEALAWLLAEDVGPVPE